LFAVIGYTYGGSGGNFTVPNLQGRIPVGRDSAQTEFDVLGETGGAKTNTLTTANMAAHTHSGSTGTVSADHTHSGSTGGISANHTHGPSSNFFTMWTGDVVFGQSGGSFGLPSGLSISSNTSTVSSDHGHSFSTGGISANHTHSFTTNNGTGSSTPVANLQPYIVVNYIIKT
jgi:microcystin-dependent protein